MKRAVLFLCAFLFLAPSAVLGQCDPAECFVARLEFNDQTTITEPVRFVVVPDNGPPPQPRASWKLLVRNISGDPAPGKYVFVVFSQAATSALCWCAHQYQPSSVLPDGRRYFWNITGADGLAYFQISAGGCWNQAGSVMMKVGMTAYPDEAVQYRTYSSIASMDNSGPGGAICDGAVNTADLQKYAIAHLGGAGQYSTCHDYNADGLVNTVDFQIYAQHHLRAAACTGP
jgi:hypothetical protein